MRLEIGGQRWLLASFSFLLSRLASPIAADKLRVTKLGVVTHTQIPQGPACGIADPAALTSGVAEPPPVMMNVHGGCFVLRER